MPDSASVRRSALFTLVALLLVALNLRLALAGVGPVLDQVRAGLDVSRGFAGLLTTVPVLCFAVLAPASAYLGSRIGNVAALFASLVVLTVGIMLRSVDGPPVVLFGTVLLGAGIAVGNVLVPAMIKAELSAIAGLAMGLYTASLTAGAAIGSLGTAWLAELGWHWRWVLGATAVPALVGSVVFGLWALAHRRSRPAEPPIVPGTSRQVWRARTSWELSGLMAGQALLFYSVLAWLPVFLQERGVSVAESGAMLSVYSILGIVGALAVPPLISRATDQRVVAVLSVAGWAVGIAGLWWLPGWYLLWSIWLGVFQGAGIAIALTLMVLRARTNAAARELSGMVQMSGYLVAGVGPWLVGALRDHSGGWSWSMGTLLAVAVLLLVAAFRAGGAEPVG